MTPEQLEQREQAERKRKTANEQYALDMRWVMSTPAGRRVMWSLLGDLGLYRTPYAGEHTNAANFNMGQHSAALRLNAQLIEHSPDEHDLMAREAREPVRAAISSKQA
jgi:hypothetical protein